MVKNNLSKVAVKLTHFRHKFSFTVFLANSFTPPISPVQEKPLHCSLITGAGPVGGRLAVWLIDATPTIETLQKDLKHIGQNIVQLTKILDQMSSIAVPIIDSEVC